MAELVARAPNLWTVDRGQRFGGLEVGTRMTVVRLADGGLWLCSAVPLDDALAAELDALGPVRWIVLPNLFHHLYARVAAARYPAARVAAPAAITAKKQPELRVDLPLSASPPESWGGAIAPIPLDGLPKLQETAFFHRPSRTLVLTDVLFNLARPEGVWARVVLGALDAAGGPRVDRYIRWLTKDRAAFRASLERALAFEPERVIMAHGAVIERGGAAALREAAAWVLRGR
ncbi:MAG: DUF4336 domain-containing protein [Myxococcales bacterium]|nr:DUF4336 domain-containing protein [Myxococcales bacterium]MCB9732715.1 DUF4336 domain-containing protein [Deltaproteobacteria bacterium]